MKSVKADPHMKEIEQKNIINMRHRNSPINVKLTFFPVLDVNE